MAVLVNGSYLHTPWDTTPTTDFTLATAYLKGLARYAALDGSELAVAVYWVRWNICNYSRNYSPCRYGFLPTAPSGRERPSWVGE